MADVTNDEIVKLMRALLTLAVDEREERVSNDPKARKTELLLDQAGLDSSEIAAMTGKQAGSVRMTLSRERRRSGSGKDGGDG